MNSRSIISSFEILSPLEGRKRVLFTTVEYGTWFVEGDEYFRIAEGHTPISRHLTSVLTEDLIILHLSMNSFTVIRPTAALSIKNFKEKKYEIEEIDIMSSSGIVAGPKKVFYLLSVRGTEAKVTKDLSVKLLQKSLSKFSIVT